jgi:hypothetical protein
MEVQAGQIAQGEGRSIGRVVDNASADNVEGYGRTDRERVGRRSRIELNSADKRDV